MTQQIKRYYTEQEAGERLAEIGRTYGINAGLLRQLVFSQDYSTLTQGMSKHAKRKLRRQLEIPIRQIDRIKEILDTNRNNFESSDPYNQDIRRSLTPEQFQDYQTGNWTPEILEVVSSAQKRYFQTRAPSPAEVEGRVKFAPAGEYRTHWNR